MYLRSVCHVCLHLPSDDVYVGTSFYRKKTCTQRQARRLKRHVRILQRDAVPTRCVNFDKTYTKTSSPYVYNATKTVSYSVLL